MEHGESVTVMRQLKNALDPDGIMNPEKCCRATKPCPSSRMQPPIAFASPLPSAVDVVVIGAGVVGTSTAYFLAKQGKRVA